MDESIREARRQRILRNSEKRLQKILGTSDAPAMSNQGRVSYDLRNSINILHLPFSRGRLRIEVQ